MSAHKGENMENAAKALRIATGVIIGMLIVTLIWYMYHQFVEIPRQEEKYAKEQEMVEFNKVYQAYNKQSIKGHKLISLMNMTIANNEKYSDVAEYHINIIVKNKFDLKSYKQKRDNPSYKGEYEKFLEQIKGKAYKCINVENGGPNGRISSMTFQEI